MDSRTAALWDSMIPVPQAPRMHDVPVNAHAEWTAVHNEIVSRGFSQGLSASVDQSVVDTAEQICRGFRGAMGEAGVVRPCFLGFYAKGPGALLAAYHVPELGIKVVRLEPCGQEADRPSYKATGTAGVANLANVLA